MFLHSVQSLNIVFLCCSDEEGSVDEVPSDQPVKPVDMPSGSSTGAQPVSAAPTAAPVSSAFGKAVAAITAQAAAESMVPPAVEISKEVLPLVDDPINVTAESQDSSTLICAKASSAATESEQAAYSIASDSVEDANDKAERAGSAAAAVADSIIEDLVERTVAEIWQAAAVRAADSVMDSLIEGTVKQVEQAAADGIKAVVNNLLDSIVTDSQTEAETQARFTAASAHLDRSALAGLHTEAVSATVTSPQSDSLILISKPTSAASSEVVEDFDCTVAAMSKLPAVTAHLVPVPMTGSGFTRRHCLASLLRSITGANSINIVSPSILAVTLPTQFLSVAAIPALAFTTHSVSSLSSGTRAGFPSTSIIPVASHFAVAPQLIRPNTAGGSSSGLQQVTATVSDMLPHVAFHSASLHRADHVTHPSRSSAAVPNHLNVVANL